MFKLFFLKVLVVKVGGSRFRVQGSRFKVVIRLPLPEKIKK
jgi:hypothetical protein